MRTMRWRLPVFVHPSKPSAVTPTQRLCVNTGMTGWCEAIHKKQCSITLSNLFCQSTLSQYRLRHWWHKVVWQLSSQTHGYDMTNNSDTKGVQFSARVSRGSTIVLVKLLMTYLTFNVYELGKHQRPIESQLSCVVVVLFRTQRLLEGVKQKHL